MPRPKSCRWIDAEPKCDWFKPVGVPLRELSEVILELDELEAIRLADREGLYHEAVAERMNVSRPTVSRILESARRKIAEALTLGKAIRLTGGPITMTDKTDKIVHNTTSPSEIVPATQSRLPGSKVDRGPRQGRGPCGRGHGRGGRGLGQGSGGGSGRGRGLGGRRRSGGGAR